MPKFFVKSSQINNGEIIIVDDDFLHLTKVLRVKENESICVSDGVGFDYKCIIKSINNNSIVLSVLDSYKTDTEPPVKITLFQSLPKSDKMELIIQKCVEIGIFSIVPMITERTVVKLNSVEKGQKKVSRFNKISEAAAKQSGRGIVPQIYNFHSFEESLVFAKKLDYSIILYEKENEKTLKHFINNFEGDNIGVFVGPEGGFSYNEISKALKNNIIPVTLGNRILRTETVGFYTAAIILYELSEII